MLRQGHRLEGALQLRHGALYDEHGEQDEEEFLRIVDSLPEKCILNWKTTCGWRRQHSSGRRTQREERKVWMRLSMQERNPLDRKMVLHHWTSWVGRAPV